jgi:hypothetical protein
MGMITMNIELTQGKVAKIDDQDADLSNVKWYARRDGRNSCWYANRVGPRDNGKQHTISMHRVILERMIGRSIKKGEETDHINHDGLDNRRANLRLATLTENRRNTRTLTISKLSRFKGVTLDNKSKKWVSRITVNGRTHALGYFDSEESAAKAYDDAAKKMFQSFCCPNFAEED